MCWYREEIILYGQNKFSDYFYVNKLFSFESFISFINLGFNN